MSQRITIDPVTRIEGHAKITLQLDDAGRVEDAHFHVTQVRGFERFSEGRPFYEMPSLMARICGICPVSHLIASAKACEAIMSVRIPHTAAQLRRMLNLAPAPEFAEWLTRMNLPGGEAEGGSLPASFQRLLTRA